MDRFATVSRQLNDAIGHVFPAAQLIVVDNGQTFLDGAVGSCTASTLFDVASLTKALVTTTLTMRHLTDGRLDLDEELRPGVTVRHALEHATGLPAWRPLHHLVEAVNSGRRAAMIGLVREHPLEESPGTHSLYSDLGFILLGDKLEQAGEARLDEQWRRLAEEIGLEATFHPAPEHCAPTHVQAELRGVVHDDNARAMEGVAGHAGLFASAAQVSSLVAALVEAWRGEARRPLVDRDLIRRFWRPCGIPGSTWCLGWDRPSPDGDLSQAGRCWPRDGVGHLGFTGCSLWIDPVRARWVVLLTNRVYPSVENRAIKRFRPLIHDEIVGVLDGA